jgi:tetratricopeptide (TPR) repeat protein
MLVIAACSTTKNKWINRGYHNMTSRFNGYFYAKENMKSAIDMVNKNYVDDYSQLLPIHQLPNTAETKGCYTFLEKAMKKATTVIEHHAITTKGGDEIPGAVKWIDDSYLIIGEARFYKGEYLSSIEIFDYLILKYSKFDIRYDAILWKAKADIEQNGYTEAQSLLDVINNDKSCPDRLQAEIKATYADLDIAMGNYTDAIKNLEEAVEANKNKKVEARYTYILGQLYEKQGKTKEAYDAYARVISLHPEYTMLFNAKLSRARLSASDPKNRTAAKKELQKMLTDGKNVDYLDQIYYTLAQLEMGANNEKGAINFYQMSVSYSIGNNKQKSLSYLALGDIYFQKDDYVNAQAYYDSTMSFLPADYPDYAAIGEKKKSLTTLVGYIDLVKTQDSLQMIVKKYGDDTVKLYPYIDKLIQQAKEDDKKKKDALAAALLAANTTTTGLGGSSSTGSWYFYNQSTITFGMTEFTRKWGNRKLEDNWRRANKESVITDDDQSTSSDTAKKAAAAAVPDKYSRKYYIKDLPFTDSAQKASDSLIADALFNLGSIYKEQLKNYPRSIESFESLCKRYPTHKYSMPSHYQLFKIYSDKNLKEHDDAKAQLHSTYICTNGPETEYCELVKNPDHDVVVGAEKKKISAYYDSTYSIYLAKDYLQVITRCNYADSVFGTKLDKNEQAAMFAYLRAISLGKTQGVAAMETAMTKIVANYPKDPIRPQAQAMLDAIHKTASTTVVDTTKAVSSIYTDNDKTEYQYVVIVETGKGDLNKFKIALSDFNTANYASAGLSVTSIILDDKHTLVSVKKFADETSGNNYYTVLRGHPELFGQLLNGTYQVFTISTENFAIFYKDKNVATYQSFFDANVKPK